MELVEEELVAHGFCVDRGDLSPLLLLLHPYLFVDSPLQDRPELDHGLKVLQTYPLHSTRRRLDLQRRAVLALISFGMVKDQNLRALVLEPVDLLGWEEVQAGSPVEEVVDSLVEGVVEWVFGWRLGIDLQRVEVERVQ